MWTLSTLREKNFGGNLILQILRFLLKQKKRFTHQLFSSETNLLNYYLSFLLKECWRLNEN